MVILYKNNTWRRKMRTKIPEISINKRICYIWCFPTKNKGDDRIVSPHDRLEVHCTAGLLFGNLVLLRWLKHVRFQWTGTEADFSQPPLTCEVGLRIDWPSDGCSDIGTSLARGNLNIKTSCLNHSNPSVSNEKASLPCSRGAFYSICRNQLCTCFKNKWKPNPLWKWHNLGTG